MSDFIERLDAAIDHEWSRIRGGLFWRHVLGETVTPAFYRGLMEQIYHYTRHNSVNQATAAYRTSTHDRKLLRFVYKHALEELGHENMVIHDLAAKGLYDESLPQQRPMASTQALIAYLYQVALERGAVARLGYSYWAESCYAHIDVILKKLAQDLALTPRDMSFFVSHSEIDAKHAQEVSEAIRDSATTAEEQDAVIDVARTTLYLTGMILEQVTQEYLASRASGVARAA